MATAPPTTVGNIIELSRELEEEGRIQGQVRLYNVYDEESVESDPDRFFDRTLMTDGLRKSLTILRDSLSGDDPRGAHLLQGPFGTGKSHQMVALYHCFNAPDAARNAFGDDISGLSEALPESAIPVTVSLQYSQPDQLWEPFFDALDYDPGSYESGGFPDVETIEEAADGRTVAFFVDELERWFNTLSDERQETTKGFLQSLLEAAGELDNIYSFMSVLQEESDVHGILNREYMVPINMNEEVNVRDLIHHRLFASPIDAEGEIEEIVDDYVETYEESEHVNTDDDLRARMYESYPFHPQLLDTLEECYYTSSENQAVRGMLFLLSKVVLAQIDSTDLITHGDLEPRMDKQSDVATELYQLDSGIHEACVGDIGRVEEADVPYGSRILTTVLIYSLRPGRIEMIGAEKSDIIHGVYRRGENISDIVRDINRVDNGKAWHLHEAGGKYAIRESQTVSALINDERAGVDEEEDALEHISNAIEEIFDGGYPVVRSDDLTGIPDSKDVKVAVKADSWSEEEVRIVIKNGDEGRQWRNTLVFVQPTDEVTDSATIDKAVEIEAARRVSEDDSLDQELRQEVEDRADREQDELRDRIEIKYGEIIDGDNLLDEFDDAVAREFDAYGVDADAEEIAEAMVAGTFNLREQIVDVTLDILNRRDDATISEIYQQFLRDPANPLPESEDAVLDVVEELEDEPVLVHKGDQGFRDDFLVTSTDDTLVHEDSVDYWDTDEIRQELRQRLNRGDVEFDDFASELRSRTDTVLTGDPSTAAEELAEEGKCVFVDGRETADRPQGSVLRTDVEVIDEEELRTRLEDTVAEENRASVRDVLADLPDTAVFDDVHDTVRGAVEALLEKDYLLEDGYTDELSEGRNPLAVTLVPTVDEETGERILENIKSQSEGDRFSLVDVASGVDERRARTFLLQHLGSSDPAYLLENGSSNPSDWTSDTQFRIPGGVWEFSHRTNDVEDLREEWREESETGEVTDGWLNFTLLNDSTTEEIRRAVDTKEAETTVRLTLESGQDHTHIRDMFDRIPANATDIRTQIEFEKQ